MTSEFRQDIITRSWVLIAEGRAKRPSDFKEHPATPPELPERSKKCVFCAGNEKETTGEIMRYPLKGEWLTRVVTNKYEAVSHFLGKRNEEFYVSRPGIGDHEVVITRPHNQHLALQSVELIDQTLKIFVDRINELKLHDEVRYIHIIQNHGIQAGASIFHPHSQIFAIPFLPERLESELRGTRDYFHAHSACVYCEMILHELKEAKRVILDTPDFLVIAPYASKMPFEMHIIPKIHRPSFQDMTISERKSLAAVMKSVFSNLNKKMHNPAYNYYIHSLSQVHTSSGKIFDDNISYHWHIVILPRVNIWAGFELGTEVYVNVMPPETAAKFLVE